MALAKLLLQVALCVIQIVFESQNPPKNQTKFFETQFFADCFLLV